MKETKDKQVSREDLEKLIRLINEIVELQIKYINQGFGTKEIAATFAQIYQRQFERTLTPEVSAKIERGSYGQPPFDNSGATISYCMTLCCAIMDVVTDSVKKNKKE